MKAAAFITARLKSERLPRKVLRPLMGRPMLAHLVDRLRSLSALSQIVLCTSWLGDDDPLAYFAEREGIDCFRGDPIDVLSRLACAAERFGVDQILSCTGDNPLTDPQGLQALYHYHVENGFDYSRCQGLPLGAFGYAVSRAALERVCRLKDGKDTEIWGGYFTQIPGFRWGTLIFNSSSPLHWPDLRVTVDTAEDFEFVQGLFQTLHQPGEIFGIDQVIALCRREKNRTSLNSHVVQRAAPSISLRKPCTS